MSGYYIPSVILLVASVFDVSTAAWNCTLNITRGDGGELPNQHCLEYHLTSSQCSAIGQEGLPIPDSELSVDPPINMEMRTAWVQVNESSGISYGTEIDLSWGPPQSGLALSYLKGFMVNCVSVYGPDCGTCVIFDLQGSNFSRSDKNLVFHWKQKPLLPDKSMSIQMELTALPRAPANRQALAQATAVPKKGTAEPLYPSFWRAPITVKVKNDNVTVFFEYPKQNFVFKHFEVRLKQGSSYPHIQKIAVYKGQTNGSHVFTKVEPGSYTVQVEPLEEHSFDEQNCFCYSDIYDGGRVRECDTCIISQVVNITVQGVPPTTTQPTTRPTTPTTRLTTQPTKQPTTQSTTRPATQPTTQSTTQPTQPVKQSATTSKLSSGASDTEIALAIVGTLLIVALLLFSFFYMKNKKKKNSLMRYDAPSPPDSPSPMTNIDGIYTVLRESNTPAPNKTVLVLSADDHIHHLMAVKKFVSYLQDVARCRVIFPPYCLTDGSKNWKDWIFKSLDKANFVVIVNSQALHFIMDANKRHEIYQYRPISDTGHMIADFILEVEKDAKQVDGSNKFIHVSFDHTPQEFQLQDPVTRNSYRIIETVELLVKHIQKPPPRQQIHPYFTEILARDIDDTPAGKELKEAIAKAARFEKSDVLWFSDRFGHAYGREWARSDSGFDSLPVETDSPTTNLLLERLERINSMSDENSFFPPTTHDGDIIHSDHQGDHHFDFFPPDEVSVSTNQRSIFLPPQTLSELESQSLSPSALIRNINQQSTLEEEKNHFLPYHSRV